MTKRVILVILLMCYILGISAISFIAGITYERHQNPVCHAITEDSYISGCDYRNGAWYRK